MVEYGPDDIEILKAIECIQRRPGMYVGELGSEGIVALLRSPIDDALDLHLAGRCSTTGISLGLPLRVWDDGHGGPEPPIEVFTQLLVGGQDNGLVCINALSRTVTLETRRGDRLRRWRFVEQALVEESWHHDLEGPASVPWTTRLSFEPDAGIFGSSLPTRERVLAEFGHLPWLFPTLRLELDGERIEQPEGLRGWVRAHGGERVEACVLEREGMRVELAWGEGQSRNVIGFVNCLASPVGWHLRGLERGLAFVGQDAAERLVAIVSVVTARPRFSSWSREEALGVDAERWLADNVAEHVRAQR